LLLSLLLSLLSQIKFFGASEFEILQNMYYYVATLPIQPVNFIKKTYTYIY